MPVPRILAGESPAVRPSVPVLAVVVVQAVHAVAEALGVDLCKLNHAKRACGEVRAAACVALKGGTGTPSEFSERHWLRLQYTVVAWRGKRGEPFRDGGFSTQPVCRIRLRTGVDSEKGQGPRPQPRCAGCERHGVWEAQGLVQAHESSSI